LTNRVVSLIVVPGWKPSLLPSVMSDTILFQSIAGEVTFRVMGGTTTGATVAVVFVAGTGDGVAAATTGGSVDVGLAASAAGVSTGTAGLSVTVAEGSPAGDPSWRL
jgi:hypothetical protein